MLTQDQIFALVMEIADLRIRLANTVNEANVEVARLQGLLDAAKTAAEVTVAESVALLSSEPARPVVSVLPDAGSESSHD